MTLLSSSAPTIHYQHAFLVNNFDKDDGDNDDDDDETTNLSAWKAVKALTHRPPGPVFEEKSPNCFDAFKMYTK